MSETHEGPPPIAGDRRGKRDMLWGRCFCWDKGAFHFRPLLILAAAALWWIAGFDWAAGALDVVHNMDLNKVLRFIAVVCAFCSFNWSLRIVREIHIVLTVLVCLPLSLIGAFFFAALIFAGVFSLIFAGVLQMMEPGFLPFSLDTVGAVLSPIALLGLFAAGSATSWLLAYYFVFVPYSLRSDHLLRSLPGSLQLMFVLWYRKSEGRDLAAARKASGSVGTLTRLDTAVLWTDCEDLELETCLATMERTSETLRRRLERKLVADGALRLLPTLAFGLDAELLRAFHRSSRGELKEVAALALDMLA